MQQIIECVPNFSEGQDPKTIEAIAKAIKDTPKVELLNVDPGKAANRTVYTFKGDPEAVAEAAFKAIKVAAQRIDMRAHKGQHPRIGAADVVPLIPIEGITLEEVTKIAKELAKRVGEELGIPVYTYEATATTQARKNLAHCRKGEYEGLSQKIKTEEGRPDFGPTTFTQTAAKSGASVIGARNLLIAVNFNLDTKSQEIAAKIAAKVRESGTKQKDGTSTKGTLEGCKAIGWYIEEYGKSQVSMNITDIEKTSLQKAFEEVSKVAKEEGAEVTGTEIIGLVPRKVLIAAGRHFAQPNENLTDDQYMAQAVKSLNLEELAPFDYKTRTI